MLLELRGKIHQGMANETNSQQDTRSTAAQRDQAKTRGRNNSSISQPNQWGPESVDPSSCFPPLCLQFLRLHKLLWYLLAVLRQHSLTSSIHDLLGRLYPDSLSLFCGGILGACFRCWSLPTHSLRRGNIASSGVFMTS